MTFTCWWVYVEWHSPVDTVSLPGIIFYCWWLYVQWHSPFDDSKWNDIPLLMSLRGMTFPAISGYPRALVLHASPPARPPASLSSGERLRQVLDRKQYFFFIFRWEQFCWETCYPSRWWNEPPCPEQKGMPRPSQLSTVSTAALSTGVLTSSLPIPKRS